MKNKRVNAVNTAKYWYVLDKAMSTAVLGSVLLWSFTYCFSGAEL